jgi:hypothetical protein
MKLEITIDNLSESQAKAIEDLLAVWQWLGDEKMSIWTSYFADGALGFTPDIQVNGEPPKRFMMDIGNRLAQIKVVTEDGDFPDKYYMIDPDKVRDALIAAETEESEDKED